MNVQLAYSFAALAITSVTAHAQLSYTPLGTSAPPTEIDGYELEAGFEIRSSGILTDWCPIGGDRSATFGEPLRLERIGDDWPFWSHGFEDAVYTADLTADEVILNLPEGEVGAIAFYLAPRMMASGPFNFNVQVTSARGDVEFVNESITGLTAEGFAFSTESGDSITTIRIRNPLAIATGFAVGEFSSAPADVDCGGWTPFAFSDSGSVVNVPITVTDSCNLLRITDGYLAGDRFNVRVRQGATVVRSFMTSIPESLGGGIGANFEAAYADPQWSSGATVLAPGNYMVQVSAIETPFGSGEAALSLVAADPCGFGQCQADFNGDGFVNIFDFLEFQNVFAAQGDCADIDGDGSLTLFDFLAFQNLFDAGC